MTTNDGPAFNATRLTPFLVLGSKPRTVKDTAWLRAEFGATSAISMLEPHEVVLAPDAYGIQVLGCPTPDYTAPKSTELAKALEHISSAAKGGRSSAARGCGTTGPRTMAGCP